MEQGRKEGHPNRRSQALDTQGKQQPTPVNERSLFISKICLLFTAYLNAHLCFAVSYYIQRNVEADYIIIT